jgi:hypothetical protein
MHSAPSVSYPVGRSAFAGGVSAGLVLLGLLVAAGWTLQSGLGWRQGTAFATVLACAGLACHGWLRSPRGVLRWDGLAWSWEEGTTVRPGTPELALDLQSRLLLRWRPDGGSPQWFWLARKAAPSHWDALRRAVYSRASTHVPAAGQPPAAEQ